MEEESLCDVLQPDIMMNIFHKLPFKSLLLCKTVCKLWYSIISHPFFKSTYNTPSIPNHPLTLIMLARSYFVKKFSNLRYEIEVDGTSDNIHMKDKLQTLPGDDKNRHLVILGSCNGLEGLYHDDGYFYLFNPYTGEHKAVQITKGPRSFRVHHNLRIHGGLSYDSCNDEYKAVLVSFLYGRTDFVVVSFQDDGNWKMKNQHVFIQDSYIPILRLGAIVNGQPHWIVLPNDTQNHPIIRFDPREERFDRLEVPQQWLGGKRLYGLGSLSGNLTAVVGGGLVNSNIEWEGLEVWVLKEYGDLRTWTSLFRIMNKLSYVSPLCLIGDRQILLDVKEQEFLIYNFHEHTLRQLYSQG